MASCNRNGKFVGARVPGPLQEPSPESAEAPAPCPPSLLDPENAELRELKAAPALCQRSREGSSLSLSSALLGGPCGQDGRGLSRGRGRGAAAAGSCRRGPRHPSTAPGRKHRSIS